MTAGPTLAEKVPALVEANFQLLESLAVRLGEWFVARGSRVQPVLFFYKGVDASDQVVVFHDGHRTVRRGYPDCSFRASGRGRHLVGDEA